MKLGKISSNYAVFLGTGLRRLGVLLALLIMPGCGSASGEGSGEGTRNSAGMVAQGAPVTPVRQVVPRPPASTAWVIFGADTVVAEVARTPDERAEGLMYRDELPDGTGMLFIFEQSEVRSFWMSNTYLALDIAYMDLSYNIVDIQQMEPLTTTPHESNRPAMFALEVRQGWFAEHGIGVGSTAEVVFGIQ